MKALEALIRERELMAEKRIRVLEEDRALAEQATQACSLCRASSDISMVIEEKYNDHVAFPHSLYTCLEPLSQT